MLELLASGRALEFLCPRFDLLLGPQSNCFASGVYPGTLGAVPRLVNPYLRSGIVK
jgi:hypothetical protein